MDPKVIHSLQYHKWDYISKPHLLLGGESVQENRVLYGLIYKSRETTKDNLIHFRWKGRRIIQRW